MRNAVPSALELEEHASRTYAGPSRAAILMIVAIVTSAVWAGLISLACLILGVSIGSAWLFAISGAIGFFVLLGLSMAAIGPDRTR
jgi:uncharacterized RDD family membrane protein YckC